MALAGGVEPKGRKLNTMRTVSYPQYEHGARQGLQYGKCLNYLTIKNTVYQPQLITEACSVAANVKQSIPHAVLAPPTPCLIAMQG